MVRKSARIAERGRGAADDAGAEPSAPADPYFVAEAAEDERTCSDEGELSPAAPLIWTAI